MVANAGETPFQKTLGRAGGKRWALSRDIARYVMVSVVAVAVLCSVALSSVFYAVVDREAQAELAAQCQNIAQSINRRTGTDDSQVIALLEQHVLVASPDTRITLIAPDGAVLFDSQASPDEMDNHALRPEVVQALETGEGEAGRYSVTLEEEALYHTMLLEEGTVLRLATVKSTVWGVMHAMVAPCVAVVALAVLVSALVGILAARRVTSVLSSVDLDHPLQNHAPEELVPLLNRINDQHKRLSAQAAERRKFTANVSHELKTPLTVVSGYAEIISNGIAKPEDVSKFAGYIHTEAQHMKTMVDDLLTLTRLDDMETSEVRMDMDQDVSLDAVVEGAMARLYPAAEARGIRMEAKTPSSQGQPEVRVTGNQRMVEELVRNLVENAIRYNVDHGFVRVTVGRDELGRPELQVADSGEGIPMDLRQKVFERFFCVDESRSKETGGTGLGLAIVKHAAQLHNATVAIRGNYPRGTVFEVSFR